eukprot:g83042.t1
MPRIFGHNADNDTAPCPRRHVSIRHRTTRRKREQLQAETQLDNADPFPFQFVPQKPANRPVVPLKEWRLIEEEDEEEEENIEEKDEVEGEHVPVVPLKDWQLVEEDTTESEEEAQSVSAVSADSEDSCTDTPSRPAKKRSRATPCGARAKSELPSPSEGHTSKKRWRRTKSELASPAQVHTSAKR